MTEWTTERHAAAKARCDVASSGPWTTGPCTGAGHVWVYRKWKPLFEPLRYLAKKFRALPIFRIRKDSYDYMECYGTWKPSYKRTPEEDSFWVQKQRDVEFVAHARADLPDALEALDKKDEEIARLEKVIIDAWVLDNLHPNYSLAMSVILYEGVPEPLPEECKQAMEELGKMLGE